MSVNKDDIMELHSTIKVLQERQNHCVQLAKELTQEVESIGDMLTVLYREYERLRNKA